MTTIMVEPASAIAGELVVPGDKSVSHRALLMALLGTEPVTIHGLAPGEDVQATLEAIIALGATVERVDEETVTVTGRGMRFLPADTEIEVDARNSGTLARLLTGLACAQSGRVRIVGDESLSSRPMSRIIRPLQAMGGAVRSEGDEGRLPLVVGGHDTGELAPINYEMPVASAQVQSAVLMAGMYAVGGATSVTEPAAIRDHTERILRRAGVPVQRTGATVSVSPTDSVASIGTRVPGDPSAAAPFILAATLLHGSMLRLPGVLASEGRSGFVDTLERMGARISVGQRMLVDGEPVVDYDVAAADGLNRVAFEHIQVPRTIDELPLLGLAFHFCKGGSTVRDAGELRAKESDRIASTVRALRACGVSAEERRDGFTIHGSGVRPIGGGTVDPVADHRIAMLGGIAGLVSRKGMEIDHAECVDVSYPGFFEILDALAVRS